MMEANQAGELEIEVTVIRCTCGQPESHQGQVCPQGRAENLGTVSYWHRSRWRRLLWRLFKWRPFLSTPAPPSPPGA